MTDDGAEHATREIAIQYEYLQAMSAIGFSDRSASMILNKFEEIIKVVKECYAKLEQVK